ncbi:nucleoside hydrolase [Fomitiporia mediterranea MF3/22]|uniref:nucleoside hydrolase n=1 Tax=Fomitiporia mediterranea (strain MF3/22) TaxID=694068 RepID=UPI0004408389|nr:nucleoside hydrolase [Fomitiporia mediterranea MF3/22]EJD03116.1 nucleoside hydrolase [Fomitiporia mediterranea MF3/22]
MAIPVIIDTDPGVDDMVALLYALACPELEILGIIVSFGNTDVDASYDNILKLYDTLARHFEKFPKDEERFPHFKSRPFLARGAAGPLEGALHSAQYFHGRDGLGDISNRYPDITTDKGVEFLQLSDKPGHELALELIKTHPARTITYIALGPLTNLALAARQDPALCRERIGRIVVMGGALDVPGNTSPVAEFNFFADPYAVKELLIDGALPLDRFLLLPLDVTTPHDFSFPQYTAQIDPTFVLASEKPKQAVCKEEEEAEGRMERSKSKSPLVHFSSAFLERTREVMREFGKDVMELHDVVAVWCAAQNPPQLIEDDPHGVPRLQEGWRAQQRLFEIERTGELTRGMLVVDRRDEALEAYTSSSPLSPLSPLAPDSPDSPKRFKTGDNRAEVQARLDREQRQQEQNTHMQNVRNDHLAVPAQVELDAPAHVHPKGVACIVQTPGSEALVSSIFSRIYGIHKI